MKNLRLPLAAACIMCFATTASADDVQFGDWTVSINPAPVVEVPEVDVKREYVVREIHETRHVQTHVSYPHYQQFRNPYHGYGSNYSIYFPWRNYRGAGFTSYYRPRTIYNYGY
ncbi:MAG: hypothetical protein AB8G99_13335 [Planctomycetaceae bacterium]